MKTFITSFVLFLLAFSLFISAQDKSTPDSLKNVSLSGLAFRSIGPAITGGRISAIAVNPSNHNEYYAGSGNGSLWKTENNGITFNPVFDGQETYPIGAIAIDPSNTNIVWVGTGENNNQGLAIYGDGIYKSEDGGKSWKNMGLKNSEQIGGIVIDPKNSDIVYVAAMGPLRNKGGDRGIYKTKDGGKTWNRVLFISDYTGCFEVHMDPRYSNILYATAHQRMNHLYSGVGGGPESGIYRSLDSGATWEKMTKGLPTEDVGRIGLAISPVNPDILYAIVEATDKDKGFYKSEDRGVSWTKQSSYISQFPFYFQKIVCDVDNVDRIYSLDVYLQVSIDGGKTWSKVSEKYKHPDNHALWIDPDNNKHLIAGCDGGVYDTYDLGENWSFKSNIPIAEIYKVTTDNSLPFYNVYIGAQDNGSLCGASRTINAGGITNRDWYYTNSGDGFQTQVDWKNPDIIYAMSQNGGLVRYDKKSGENLYIRPFDFADSAYRFDWDAALLISQHDNKRLYFGGNKILRTDDMGNTWKVISPDLTRGVPQEMLRIMGQSWSIDQLGHKGSMAQITTIAESPIDENILFAGSGDGLIHFTTDGGTSWTKSSIPGLPEYSRINKIVASNFDRLVAYAACHDFRGGDYQPYLYKTTDGGKTWSLINNNLPEKGSTYSFAEDFVDKDLLFVGTQFGVFFSNNGGKEWIPLKNGIPAECVTDMVIQKNETDLVVSTFGRGVYILDNYSPLRSLSKETLKKDADIFPVKDALMFIPSHPLGYRATNPLEFRGIGFLGANFYSAPNPPLGAIFTYYIKNDYKTLKELRRDKEKEEQKKGEDIKYPPYDTLKSEMNEPEAYLLFTITDANGNIVRKLKADIKKGVHRIVWDFRYDTFSPISFVPFDNSVYWAEPEKGYMVVPGKYYVSLSKFEDDKFTQLAPPQEFTCKILNNTTLPAKDKIALDKFNKKVAELTRAVSGTDAYRKELNDKIKYFKEAVLTSARVPDNVYQQVISLEDKLKDFNLKLNGDPLRTKYEAATPISIKDRVDLVTAALWSTTAAPTTTFIKSYDTAADVFGQLLTSLKSIDEKVKQLEKELEKYGAPYTPGRFPEWKKN